MKTSNLRVGDVVEIPARGFGRWLYVGKNNRQQQLFCSIRRPRNSNPSIYSTVNSYVQGYSYREWIDIHDVYKWFYCNRVFIKQDWSYHHCKFLYNVSPGPKRRKTKQTSTK